MLPTQARSLTLSALPSASFTLAVQEPPYPYTFSFLFKYRIQIPQNLLYVSSLAPPAGGLDSAQTALAALQLMIDTASAPPQPTLLDPMDLHLDLTGGLEGGSPDAPSAAPSPGQFRVALDAAWVVGSMQRLLRLMATALPLLAAHSRASVRAALSAGVCLFPATCFSVTVFVLASFA